MNEDTDKKFEELKDDIREIKAELKLFTDAWQQARGVITFIKWLTGIAGGAATVKIGALEMRPLPTI